MVYPTTPINNVYEYNYDDKNLEPAKYIYRLKMIDLDEKYKYSNEKTVSINCVNSTDIILYPNPTNENSNLIIQSDIIKEVTVKVVDQLGKTISVNTHNLKKGNNILPIYSTTFANGIYSIIIIDGDKKQVLKFNKQ